MSDRKLYEVLLNDYPSAKTRKAPAAVTPVETRHGPWTGNQTLGSSRLWDPATMGRQTIFKLPEWGMPKMWTVSLGIDTTQANWGGLHAFDLTAEVIFGAGGTYQTVELDWVDGAAITVPASAIEVVARLYTNTNIPFVNPQDVRLSVQVGQGSTGVPSATRTFRMQCNSMVPTTAVRIPNFARWFSILNASNLATGQLSAYSAQIEYLLRTGAAGIEVVRLTGNMLPFHSCVIPIPASARYFLVNNTGATTAMIAAVFGLAY